MYKLFAEVVIPSKQKSTEVTGFFIIGFYFTSDPSKIYKKDFSTEFSLLFDMANLILLSAWQLQSTISIRWNCHCCPCKTFFCEAAFRKN